MDFKKTSKEGKEGKALRVPPPKLIVPMQGTVVHNPDGSVLGVLCGHGWVANEDGTPTMKPTISVIVPTDTKRKMVVVLPAEIANLAGAEDEEEKPRLITEE